MLKFRRISGLASVCLLAVAVFTAQAQYAAQYAAQEGGGSSAPAYAGDVIVISSLEDLNMIGREPAYPLNGNYELGGHIDASSSRAVYGADGFEPIGKYSPYNAGEAFSGKFDGKGYEIRGLFINRPYGNASGQNIGLFGYVQGASIQNVRLVDCDITGNKNVGALVGMSHSAAVTGCYSSGSVKGPAGESLAVEGADIGGLVGWLGSESELSASYSMASVGGLNNIGGLVGTNNSSKVDRCYAAGAVYGTGTRAGGLVGYNDYFSAISNGFSVAAVDGANNVGGFVGANENGSKVTTCYSAGAVKGSGEGVGGFVGSNTSVSLAYCYWDRDRSGMEISLGGGIGRSTEQMGRAEKSGTAGINWDFAAGSPWGMSNSFPYLKDLPYHTVTFTTTAGGTVAGGTAPHVQIVNAGVDGGNVTAAVNLLEGGDQFSGWYLKGESDKLAAGDHDGFSVAALSGYDGRTIALSKVAADVEIEARFVMMRYELVYIAGANGKILAEGETEAKEEYWVLVEYGKEGPKVTAVPDYGYRLQTWEDFSGSYKTDPVRSDVVTHDITYRALFVADPTIPPPPPVSVLARDREIPQVGPDGEAIVIAPTAVTAGEFAAGPNPILKRSGAINIFWSGGALDDGTLSIYDASGNLVKKISVRDKSIGISGKRQISSWDLRDRKSFPVAEGTYLIKGMITTISGNKEKVSIIIGVR